jgi:hypothetical protein
MGLKKLFKKARKALHIPAITLGNVAKVGAAVATGGVGAGALALGAGALKSKLKSAAIGGIKQVVRTKAQKAAIKRMGTLAPPKVVDIRASTMPGGAPLRGVAVKRTRKVAAAKPKAPKRPAKARSGAKRSPPKGGKDLKALAASWKAAGKPGKWLDWVKTH